MRHQSQLLPRGESTAAFLRSLLLDYLSRYVFVWNVRPDVTFAVDWALKANYLSIYLCMQCMSYLSTVALSFLRYFMTLSNTYCILEIHLNPLRKLYGYICVGCFSSRPLLEPGKWQEMGHFFSVN